MVGIKSYGEAGGISLWGTEVLEMAVKAAEEPKLPLNHLAEVITLA